MNRMNVGGVKTFPFVNRQGGKPTCHKTLRKAQVYGVMKRVEWVLDHAEYWFEAYVVLPAPQGRCRRLVQKCFPDPTRGSIKLFLGHANCYGGTMMMIKGIA